MGVAPGSRLHPCSLLGNMCHRRKWWTYQVPPEPTRWHFPQDTTKDRNETTIDDLRKQLQSSNEKNTELQTSFDEAKEEYEAIIAEKNDEIEKLETEKEDYSYTAFG